jgi:uncharacterized protein YjiS (DUF1127 family)
MWNMADPPRADLFPQVLQCLGRKATNGDRRHIVVLKPVVWCADIQTMRFRDLSEEASMFSTFASAARTVYKEWRRRSLSRQELARFGSVERRDLGCRFDLRAEMQKPFWQA